MLFGGGPSTAPAPNQHPGRKGQAVVAQGGGKLGGLELRKSSSLGKLDDGVLDLGEVNGGGMGLGEIDGRGLDLNELRDEEDLPGGEVRGDKHDRGARERQGSRAEQWRAGFFCSPAAVQVGQSGGSASYAEQRGTEPFGSASLILVGS